MRRRCQMLKDKEEAAPLQDLDRSGKMPGRGLRLQPPLHPCFQMPGLIWDQRAKKARLDEVICVGCGACTDVCPQEAIRKEARKN